jgi:hypothetical protein
MRRRATMGRSRVGAPRRAAPLLAILLFAVAAVAPPAAMPVAPFLGVLDAPVALAADGLAIDTTARYTIEPDEGVVRVGVAIRVHNERPNSVQGGVVTRFYYDVVRLAVQPEAVRVRATQDGVAVPVKVSRGKEYRIVTISLRDDLYYGQRATLRLSFDLPSGKPRSDSDVRVGTAFAAFVAWAFGDSAAVRITVPAGFEVDVSGAEMATSSGEAGTVLAAETSDPLAWYAWVTARNDDALSRERLDLPGGEEIVVRGWPEDGRWRKRVAEVLETGIPELVSLIGLAWPVDGPLTLVEVHSPLLEGYAGFYDTGADEITVSEQLDDQTIVHEASHAWFNGDLFTERWISEGLADEYSARVLDAQGETRPGPDEVSRAAKVAFPLSGWPPPAAIRDETAAATERYGYDASWTVIRQVVDAVGEDGMRAVFGAAANRTTAYPGEGAPEPAGLANDWRRFLDLTEELGGAAGIDDLVAEWALTPDEAALLGPRDDARDDYRDLVAEGDGWAAPAAVRLALDRWAFGDAGGRIAEAGAILAQRETTEALARDLGLTPSDDLETAYEGAEDAVALADAAALAADTQATLEGIDATADAAAAPRDWLVSLGLEGRDPDADLTAARAAWEDGDLATAADQAASASAVLQAAPEAGRRRALLVAIGVAVAIMLALLVVLLWRRSRARRRPPEGQDPYATLG